MILYRSRSLHSAIALLFIVVSAGSVRSQVGQSSARDDERIWLELDITGQLDRDQSNASCRGGGISFRVSGYLEPVENDDPDILELYGDDNTVSYIRNADDIILIITISSPWLAPQTGESHTDTMIQFLKVE